MVKPLKVKTQSTLINSRYSIERKKLPENYIMSPLKKPHKYINIDSFTKKKVWKGIRGIGIVTSER